MKPDSAGLGASKLLEFLKQLLPHRIRQQIKRKLFHVNDMEARLANLKRAGFACKGAVDGGAYAGEWTRQFWSVYPGVPSVLVEPLPDQKQILDQMASKVAGSRHLSAALGAEKGEARFRSDETNSGVVTETGLQENASLLMVEMTTLDAVLEQFPNFHPNLLKLDLQGFELECLRGCQDLSKRFEVIILEVSVIPIGGVPRFAEVDRYLEDRGFRLYDFIPQYYRPLDGALWQCDAFYVRQDSSLIQSMEWD